MFSPVPALALMIVGQQVAPTFKPVIELRTRFDRRQDRDLSDANSDNRTLWEQRARLGVDFKFGEKISGRVRYQYAHTLAWTPTRTASDESSDLYLGHIDFKTTDGTVTVGRQILKFGNNRLFEESNFGQRSKSFDGIRFSGKRVDAFVAKVGYSGSRSEQARLLGGAYRWQAGESLVYLKNDSWVTQSNVWTFDHRYTQKFNRGDFALEGAVQRGRVGGLDVDAFWMHGRFNYDVNSKIKTYAEGNVASGGISGNKTRRFDARYGTPHSVLGLVDMQSLTNVRHVELGVNYKPNKTSEYSLSLHRFWLYDKSDGWYGGTSINSRPGGQFIDPTGYAGNDLGSEVNLTGKWDLSKLYSVQLEGGVFFPGKFVRSFNGPATTNQYWAVLSYIRRF